MKSSIDSDPISADLALENLKYYIKSESQWANKLEIFNLSAYEELPTLR
jgi:hypothetical protein